MTGILNRETSAAQSSSHQPLKLSWPKYRILLSIALSASCTILWFFFVTKFDLWDRISGLWPASLTMLFGSIVAGSTPQGGGVVAFPVFTKFFGTPPEVARTFSLCIQSVGMTAGAAWIIINRKPVEWRAVLIVTVSAAIGLLATRTFGTSATEPFRPSLLPDPYVKVTFTFLLIATAFVIYEVNRIQRCETRLTLPKINRRIFGILVVCGAMGGAASALVGSGADVFLYLAIVLFLSVDPKVGVPTSVICMAAVSILGMALFAIEDGQLYVALDSSGFVTSVNGQPVAFNDGHLAYGSGAGAPPGKYDIFGLWLACIPVVVWGAPIGTWVASWLSSRNLIRFVTFLALLDGLTTVVFLKSLHSDMALLAYFVAGIILTICLLRFIANRRGRIFRT